MHSRRLLHALLVLLVAAAPALAQEAVPTETEDRLIFGAFQRGDYAEAARLIDLFLERAPNHVQMLYNAACAHSRLGARDEAAAYLLRSVKAGFVDFDHMRSDPDLEAIRDHLDYQAIEEAVRRVGGRPARPKGTAQQRWKANFGEADYRFERDEARRLAYATALDDVSHREMRRMLQRQADQMISTLFDGPPVDEVLIAVPTPADARQLFGDNDQVGGIYEHPLRRLVARDTGVSLRHEFVHAVHYGDMQRRGQQHPLWIQEGLASLYEDYELNKAGTIRFLPNGRHNIIHRRVKSGRAMKWTGLFEIPSDKFMRQAGQLYPQVRSIFEYIADQGQLSRWYTVYVENFDADTTGARAMEIVFDRPLEQVERDWRSWVMGRPSVDVAVEFGDASLGVQTEARARNDGVLVTGVLRGSGANVARIRRGDVIVAIDGQSTRSLAELQSAIAGKSVGDRVAVRLRRGESYVTTNVTLQPLTPYR